LQKWDAPYLLQSKARQIVDQFIAKKITNSRARSLLRDLYKIDKNNPMVEEHLNTLEYLDNWSDIERLWKEGNISEAITKAKKSHNLEVREHMAEVLITMVKEGLENESLGIEVINIMVQDAYELCPHNPVIQEYYRISTRFPRR
jgi:hypothetical protein